MRNGSAVRHSRSASEGALIIHTLEVPARRQHIVIDLRQQATPCDDLEIFAIDALPPPTLLHPPAIKHRQDDMALLFPGERLRRGQGITRHRDQQPIGPEARHGSSSGSKRTRRSGSRAYGSLSVTRSTLRTCRVLSRPSTSRSRSAWPCAGANRSRCVATVGDRSTAAAVTASMPLCNGTCQLS